ncbi:hypothetical protein [Pseudodesulfovibrio indicus]|nr:hypothetical protein [Pseudodesulfovibrio indicus]
MSYSVVETEGLSSVCEKLSQTLTKSKDLKQLNKLKAQIQTIKTITNYDFDSPSATTTLTEIATPQIKDVLKRLFNHNLQGYYFLEKTEATGDSTGYVLLLREVRMIPDKLMKLVAQGLTQDEAKAMGIEHHIQFSENWDMAYPIGKLVSPTIEHVMQTFALLFSRIGVEDINDQYIQHMLTKFSE